jgi:hypothetical protein
MTDTYERIVTVTNGSCREPLAAAEVGDVVRESFDVVGTVLVNPTVDRR